MNRFKSSLTVEQRVTAALNNSNVGSDELIELITVVEAAAQAAAAAAKVAREHALDIAALPAADKAVADIAASELLRDRLNTALPKLQDKLNAALAHERRERWLEDCNRVRARRDAVSARLTTAYRSAVEQLLAAFKEVEETDKEVDRLNGAAPDDVGLRLASVELHARELDQFTTSNPSVLEETHLRDWATGEAIWPPPQPSLAAIYAAGMVPYFDPRYNAGRWNEVVAERDAQQHQENERTQASYAAEAQQREEAENAATRERVAALQRGGR